jgi:glycosyltransferase involved in cell wall biosynthesis
VRILQVNKYHTVRGGADRVYFETIRLLSEHGHQVVPFSMADQANEPTPYERYFVKNLDWATVRGASWSKRLGTVVRSLYDINARRQLATLLHEFCPDVAHLHNLHYQLSPAILHTLHRFGVPVVMTLHDFRLSCPNGYHYNQVMSICEACRGHRYWNAVRYRCLKDSRAGSALAAAAVTLHTILRLWRLVDVFITPSMFLRQKMLDSGVMSPERIVHAFYFVEPARYIPADNLGSYVLLFCYLVPQKGVMTLLRALTRFPNLPVRVAGEGPAETEMRTFIQEQGLSQVEMVGFVRGEALHDLVRGGTLTIVPSEWYENSPMTIYESYAVGRPVLASRIGGIPELVEEGETGSLFQPGDVGDLADKLQQMLSQGDRLVEWGKRGRQKLERELGPERYYQQLMAVYHQAVARHAHD